MNLLKIYVIISVKRKPLFAASECLSAIKTPSTTAAEHGSICMSNSFGCPANHHLQFTHNNDAGGRATRITVRLSWTEALLHWWNWKCFISQTKTHKSCKWLALQIYKGLGVNWASCFRSCSSLVPTMQTLLWMTFQSISLTSIAGTYRAFLNTY